jgi:hypothetical protein
MLKHLLYLLGWVLAITLSPAYAAPAKQILSWNLSRDVMTDFAKNPSGVWAFMENNLGNTNPAKYRLLPTFSAPCDMSFWDVPKTIGFNCWQNLKSLDDLIIGVGNGVLEMHPGTQRQILIRWKSPVTANISILGRISHLNKDHSDGIKWYIKTDQNVLQAKVIKNGQSAQVNIQVLSVKKGSNLYFVIDKAKDNGWDTTELDVLIVTRP